ncbi:IS110 family transposase [Sphingomonas carotinifaciens]|uniref:IS110 family transposase n=1 Tax=Sphingomonas carotinifaciens TaxID=1166323 RepID=UPI0039A0E12B
MSEATTIGLDIAKHVFHAHGADAAGRAVFRRRLTRGKLLDFFAAHPRCLVALEACGGAHHWARELRAMGHEVRLIPPAYVKPFVKRHKNDAVDAEAICEAAQRLSMRFVAVKSEEQAAALVFRTRDDAMRRLCTVPGVGPVTAGAIMAFAPDLRTFASGRNFAASPGLVPRQRSTGGKTRLGSVSKMGQADIRKLLIVGAMSRIRWIVRKGVLPDNWFGHVLGRKPRMVAAVALANKMARMIWAMMTREENYRMA